MSNTWIMHVKTLVLVCSVCAGQRQSVQNRLYTESKPSTDVQLRLSGRVNPGARQDSSRALARLFLAHEPAAAFQPPTSRLDLPVWKRRIGVGRHMGRATMMDEQESHQPLTKTMGAAAAMASAMFLPLCAFAEDAVPDNYWIATAKQLGLYAGQQLTNVGAPATAAIIVIFYFFRTLRKGRRVVPDTELPPALASALGFGKEPKEFLEIERLNDKLQSFDYSLTKAMTSKESALRANRKLSLQQRIGSELASFDLSADTVKKLEEAEKKYRKREERLDKALEKKLRELRAMPFQEAAKKSKEASKADAAKSEDSQEKEEEEFDMEEDEEEEKDEAEAVDEAEKDQAEDVEAVEVKVAEPEIKVEQTEEKPAKRSRKNAKEAKEEAKEADEEAKKPDEAEQLEEKKEPTEEEAADQKAVEEVIVPPAPEPEKKTSRLMIKQIVLENFKSYGGVKIIGPFHKSFSSIVGPNGSGKSNTIDALLFVFGKRAKKMRLNKVSELIHCSGTMRNPPSAKVSVTFQDIVDTGDGEHDYEVVEGSVLTVSREAFRNNQSKYYVDGKSSNFSDVTSLLKRRGVDLEHNRFLILQGEVEQISLMKPKAQGEHDDGLLEYLEDIIGSNRLLEPIKEQEGVVAELSEQRQEKLNGLRVKERERQALEGPCKEAEKFLMAESERLELTSLVSQSEVKKNSVAYAEMKEKNKGLTEHMEEHKKNMMKFETEMREAETEHNKHLKEYEAIQVKHQKKTEEFKDLERKDTQLTEDIGFHEQKKAKLQQQAEQEKQNAEQLVADAERMRNEAPQREKELAQAEKEKKKMEEDFETSLAGFKNEAAKLRPLKEKKEAELVPIAKSLTDVKKKVDVASNEAHLLNERAARVEEQIEEVKNAHSDCNRQLKEREQELKVLSAKKSNHQALVSEAKDRLKQLTPQLQSLQMDVQAARVKAEEAKSSFVEETDRGRLIRAVYEQSRAGKLRGVHGRLGDLGTINKKYDIAVTTACGHLDSIVVDTKNDGQALIEFVRRENLGRVTCICLDTIQHVKKEIENLSKTPEGVPRLFELIKPSKPEYAVPFFFGVKHTLVAESQEQATRVGLQGRTRWRVVTIQGSLVESSGAMSGGGQSVKKGGMKSSACQFTKEQVAQICQDYQQKYEVLMNTRQEVRNLEEAVASTEKELAELDFNSRKADMDVTNLTKQVNNYQERLNTMQVPKLSGDEKKKLRDLEKFINSKAGELNELHAKHDKLQGEIRDIRDQILNVGGEELKTKQWKLEEQKQKVEEMRKYNKKALLDADQMDKNAKKAAANVETAKAEHAAAEAALAKLTEELKKLENIAEEILGALGKMEEEMAEKGEVLTSWKQKRDEIIDKARKYKEKEVYLVMEMEEQARQLNELKGKVENWKKKLLEAREEYKTLPLDLLASLREQQESGPDDEASMELARRAVNEDLSDEDLADVGSKDIHARMLMLEADLKELKPNLSSIEEFRRVDSEFKSRQSEYDEVNNQREDARRKLGQLRETRLEEFMKGFSVISMKLKEMYQMITLGGDAELELVDTLDPFNEGINFSVRPRMKSWKQITNLSGGEKTLASLSLVFALHHYRPTPLYFMDEIDAALDFRNVSIIANYIKERTKNAQFIVISLRNHMFELADLLVGIYKTHDISKSKAIKPDLFEVKAAPMFGNGKRPALAALQDKHAAAELQKRQRTAGA
mmetsp:Transcript_58854/g.110798  ORF Transcript_58854/g.110798 Transcript_58854/m.110798 type:complete len:1698 (+) Transcript_58854:62-5155(+)